MSYAAALLLTPDDPPTMRAVAREVGMSPQAISNAARLLADQGLVVDGRAAIPELFEALADVWRPVKTAAVATAPDPSSPRLAVNVDDLDQAGWALGGDAAALELGAPVFATDDRPTYWVPSQTELRRAQRLLGTADPTAEPRRSRSRRPRSSSPGASHTEPVAARPPALRRARPGP